MRLYDARVQQEWKLPICAEVLPLHCVLTWMGAG